MSRFNRAFSVIPSIFARAFLVNSYRIVSAHALFLSLISFCIYLILYAVASANSSCNSKIHVSAASCSSSVKRTPCTNRAYLLLCPILRLSSTISRPWFASIDLRSSFIFLVNLALAVHRVLLASSVISVLSVPVSGVTFGIRMFRRSRSFHCYQTFYSDVCKGCYINGSRAVRINYMIMKHTENRVSKKRFIFIKWFARVRNQRKMVLH